MTELDASPPMHQWAQDLWPITRSLTGAGVRETIAYLQQLVPGLTRHSIASGTKAFDWTVPDEWNIDDAYIADETGKRVVDFKVNNLHVLGYSEPVDKVMPLGELREHLYTHPKLANAIPYVTSYYKRRWGFCLSGDHLAQLGDGNYRAVIDSELAPGNLDYADIVIPGETDREILFSTYVCHPSMANNELSGVVVTAALARWIQSLPHRRYTYRFVFVPETIGSIVYISRHLEELKEKVDAGFVVTCVGDERAYSYLPSRLGGTLADRVALSALNDTVGDYDSYPFSERGSDERQYCSPGVDLPVASLMRSKYDTYPEYHTSLDDLEFVTQAGLEGAYRLYQACVGRLERNALYQVTTLCEPQLGPRGLYPTTSTEDTFRQVQLMMDVIAYSDGDHDLLTLSEKLGASFDRCADIAEKIFDAGLFKKV